MIDDNNYSGVSIYEIESLKRKPNMNKIILSILVLVALLCSIFTICIILSKPKKYQETSTTAIETSKQKTNNKLNLGVEKIVQIESMQLPKLTDEGRQNIDNIYHSEIKRAFLTFDDGPSTNTIEILKILQQENIKATFFVLGSQVEKMPETVKTIYNKGHYIASHGYSHVYSQIYASPQSVLDEYNASVQAIRNAIGQPNYDPHLFRYPGGLIGGKYATIKNEAKELLSQNNIVNIDWNALNGDGETNDLSPEFEMMRLKETVGEKNSIVVLMHDAQAKTVTKDTLPQIITYLKEQGYVFQNFYDIIK